MSEGRTIETLAYVAPLDDSDRTAADAVLASANAMVIADPHSYENAAETVRLIATYARDIEEKRKTLTRPLDESKRRIMDFFRVPLDRYNSARSVIQTKMMDYRAEERRKAEAARVAAERAAQAERERLEEQARIEAERGNTAKAIKLAERAETTVAAIVAPAIPKVSGIVARELWRFEIVDESKIPREFLMPDERKIGALVRALKGDAQAILGQGVRVFSEESIGARSVE
jgi:hypothetical protein